MNKPDIVVTFPPDFDGELHFRVVEEKYSYTFTFEHTKSGCDSAWAALVVAAKSIIAQDDRRSKK